MPGFDLPPLVREKARRLGAVGEQWLDGLGPLVEELADAWSLTVGSTFAGGSAALVVRVRTPDGDAVLKALLPEPGAARQVETLVAADGRGYARVLAHDAARLVVVLEALGPSLADAGVRSAPALRVIAATLREAWSLAPWPALLDGPQGRKAASLGAFVQALWEELDRPCSERVVEQALAYAARRSAAFTVERSVVVHGDPHPGNLLRVRAARPGAPALHAFVDPDGFLEDPAYDLGVALRDWSSELLVHGDPAGRARGLCRLLAAETGVDETAIWEWALLERVSTGLYLLQLGAAAAARRYLRVAEEIVQA